MSSKKSVTKKLWPEDIERQLKGFGVRKPAGRVVRGPVSRNPPGDQIDSINTNFQRRTSTRKYPLLQSKQMVEVPKGQSFQKADDSLDKNGNPKYDTVEQAVVGKNVVPSKGEADSPVSEMKRKPTRHSFSTNRQSSAVSHQSSSFCFISQGDVEKDFQDPVEQHLSNPESYVSMTDFCAYCCNKQKHTVATHFCPDCGIFGRYICQYCLGDHNRFTEEHDVKSLSGESFRQKKEKALDCTTELKRILSDVSEEASVTEHPQLHREVPIRSENDEQTCQITGFCQLPDDSILVTEMNNKAVKRLDSSSYVVTESVQLSEYPTGICCISNNQALVIMYKSFVQYINFEEEMKLKRRKEMKHDCVCIAYCNEKIFIGSSTALYIYDKMWSKIDEITADLFGELKVFSDKFSVVVTEMNGKFIVYVADEYHGMYCIEIAGHGVKQLWRFMDSGKFKASGVCIDNEGHIYVCDRGTDRLVKMTGEGMILSVMLDSRSGVQSINVPFYDRENNTLLLALSNIDTIRVFSFE